MGTLFIRYVIQSDLYRNIQLDINSGKGFANPFEHNVYTDLNLRDGGSGAQSTDEISPLYQRLIGLSSNFDDDEFDLGLGNSTERKIQETIVEIYEILTAKLAKKNGLIRQGLLGKATENAVRAVISGPKLDSDTYDTQQVPYGYIGLPLYLVLYAFKPFIIYEIDRIFNSSKDDQITVLDNDSNVIVDSELEEITPKKIENLINKFTKSHKDRFLTVAIINKSEEDEGLFANHSDIETVKTSEGNVKRLTLARFLFDVATAVVQDKHVICTRYPVEDYRNVAPMKVKILTTEIAEPGAIDSDGKPLDNAPYLPEGASPENIRWIDSARPQNLYLSGFGGDFDGDDGRCSYEIRLCGQF